jgi:hypothetical protein
MFTTAQSRTHTLALSLLPGKTECWRRFQQDLAERGALVSAAFLHADVHAQRWLLVLSARGDIAIWIVDGLSLDAALATMAAGNAPVTRWMRRQWRELFGVDLTVARELPRVEKGWAVAHVSPTASA